MLIDGDCSLCDPHKITSEDKKTCIKPVCPERHQILKDGSCDLCPVHNIVTPNGIGC